MLVLEKAFTNKIILKAMKKEANTRYQTATEMLRDLGMALKNPEGNCVNDKGNTNAYTQVVPTLANEEIKRENFLNFERKFYHERLSALSCQ